MITVDLDGTTLSIQGHAGAAPYGQDLVCAAVSALAYALATRLTELEQQDALKEPPVIRLLSGNALISAVPKEAYIRELAEAFRVVAGGLHLLAEYYPNQLQVLGQLT